MAERNNAVDFYDPKTWTLIKSVPIPHNGVNHAEFTADGKTMVASCEFSGFLVRIDLDTMAITGELNVGGKMATVDVLGEEITREEETRAIAQAYRDGKLQGLTLTDRSANG